MDTTPLEIKRKIALELSPKDLIELCLASKESFYKRICDDKEFWRLKVFHDYPEIEPYFENMSLINPKNTYMRIFSQTAKVIERNAIPRYDTLRLKNIKTVNTFVDLRIFSQTTGEGKKELSNLEKKELFSILYETYNEIRKKRPKNSNEMYEIVMTKSMKYEINYEIMLYLLENIFIANPLTKIYGAAEVYKFGEILKNLRFSQI